MRPLPDSKQTGSPAGFRLRDMRVSVRSDVCQWLVASRGSGATALLGHQFMAA